MLLVIDVPEETPEFGHERMGGEAGEEGLLSLSSVFIDVERGHRLIVLEHGGGNTVPALKEELVRFGEELTVFLLLQVEKRPVIMGHGERGASAAPFL